MVLLIKSLGQYCTLCTPDMHEELLSGSSSVLQDIGSLNKRVFETQTATGREHFVCYDSIVTQVFILLISNGETILSNVNVVV